MMLGIIPLYGRASGTYQRTFDKLYTINNLHKQTGVALIRKANPGLLNYSDFKAC